MSTSLSERKRALMAQHEELLAQSKELLDKLTAGTLSEEEQQQYDAIVGRGVPGQPGYTPGKLDQVRDELDRIVAIERHLAGEAVTAAMKARQAASPPASSTQAPADLDQLTRIVARQHLPPQRSQSRADAFGGVEPALRAGAWCAAVLFGHEGAKRFCNEIGYSPQMGLTGGSDGGGGSLVPVELERTILRFVEEYGTYARVARLLPMATDTHQINISNGFLEGYFLAEEASAIESKPTVELATLRARTLVYKTGISYELAEDSFIDLASYIAQIVAQSLALKIDQCGFLGDGTSTYGGIVGIIPLLSDAKYAGSNVTAASGHTSFGTLTEDDFVSMVGKLPRFALNPRWYISNIGWAKSMLRLAAKAGGNSMMDLEGRIGPSYLGYPVEIVQIMNSNAGTQTSTNGLVLFGDLSMSAVLGMRRGLTFETFRDPDVRQVRLYATARFDTTLVARGNDTTAGGVVMLNTPAS